MELHIHRRVSSFFRSFIIYLGYLNHLLDVKLRCSWYWLWISEATWMQGFALRYLFDVRVGSSFAPFTTWFRIAWIFRLFLSFWPLQFDWKRRSAWHERFLRAFTGKWRFQRIQRLWSHRESRCRFSFFVYMSRLLEYAKVLVFLSSVHFASDKFVPLESMIKVIHILA